MLNAKCHFVVAAAAPDQFPVSPLPEIAFVGRSNAGKSTLINALTGQKRLAHASKTPGRTQQIVFFNADNKLMIADLPGYGHAKAPKAAVAAWNGLIRAYLKKRVTLRCVVLLIDSRHGVMEKDENMMELLDQAAVNYQVILAKADYLRAPEREERKKTTTASLRKHPAARPDVMSVSAEKNIGLDDLRDWLAGFAVKP
jgi:GTP-binding protein